MPWFQSVLIRDVPLNSSNADSQALLKVSRGTYFCIGVVLGFSLCYHIPVERLAGGGISSIKESTMSMTDSYSERLLRYFFSVRCLTNCSNDEVMVPLLTNSS